MFVLLTLLGCEDRPRAAEGTPEAAPSAALTQLPSPSLTRAGKAPDLTHDPPTRTESDCGYQIEARHLYALSNQRLSKLDDVGRVSPVVVLEDGKPLRGFALKKDFEERCSGAFNFGRNAIRFSPTGDSVDAADVHSYALGLTDDFPMQTPDGTAWWAYPGTRVDISFPDDGGLAGQTVELVVTGTTPQGRIKGTPVLRFGDEKVLMEQSEDDWTGALSLTVPDGEWTAALVTPPEGPYMIIGSISLHRGDEIISLMPASDAPTALASDTEPVATDEGPGLNLLSTVQFADAPPALALQSTLNETGEFLGRFREPDLAALSTPLVRDLIGVPYSPIRILEDGKPLADSSTSCRKVKEHGKGRYCHSRDVILLSSSDNSAPSGHSYTVTFSEDRRFEGGWWLYPTDTLRSTAAPSGAPSVGRLVLAATPISSDAGVTLRLKQAGAMLLEKTVAADELTAEQNVFRIEDLTDSGELALEVESSGHVVLQRAALEWDG